MFHHVVLFKLNANSEKNLQKASILLQSMAGNIRELQELEVGVNVLSSDRSYELYLKASFLTDEDYADYQTHPFHVERVLYNLKPMLSDSKTCDFLT